MKICQSFQVRALSSAKLHGVIASSPSKSHTLRAILFASLARGKSKIAHYLLSPDAEVMICACKLLGAEIIFDQVNADADEVAVADRAIVINGVAGKTTTPDDVINAGNSGQVLRFIAAIAALNADYTILTGDHSVRHNRPMQPLIEGLRGLGVFCISTKNDGYAPIIIKGPMQSGVTRLNGEDSQPVSALLIAASFLDARSEIMVDNPGEKPWIDLTLYWLQKIGVNVENHNYTHYVVHGGAAYDGFDYAVPGDFSSMLFPIVAALITNSTITLQHVDMHDIQGDKKVIEVLREMGANIHYDEKQHSLIVNRVADRADAANYSLSVPSRLIGREIDANDFIDAVPILAVLGCFAKGKTRIFNAAIARAKECDRISAITIELKKMGAKITEFPDGLEVEESELKGTRVQTYHDHRMVMSLAVAGMAAQGTTIVEDIASVAKSYPSFYEDMKKIGANIAIVDDK